MDPYNSAIKYLREKYGSTSSNDLKGNDLTISLLLGQYYYGITAKNELILKIKSMRINYNINLEQ